MFISKSILASIVFASAALTNALPNPDNVDNFDKRVKAQSFNLQVPEWVYVSSPAKYGEASGWGGCGERFWNFKFDYKYQKEEFTMNIYEQKNGKTWQGGGFEPDLKKFKVLKCVIEVDLEQEAGRRNATLSTKEPYIRAEGATKAECKIKE